MKNKQNNNALFHRATKKPKTERVWDGDDMCKIPCIVRDHVVGIPQDVDTKIALHNIEERGVTAINELLDLGEESYNMDSSVSQGGSNSANYDHIKWEDKEAKEFEARHKYCTCCGNRLATARVRNGYETCSKECQDIWFKNEIIKHT